MKKSEGTAPVSQTCMIHANHTFGLFSWFQLKILSLSNFFIRRKPTEFTIRKITVNNFFLGACILSIETFYDWSKRNGNRTDCDWHAISLIPFNFILKTRKKIKNVLKTSFDFFFRAINELGKYFFFSFGPYYSNCRFNQREFSNYNWDYWLFSHFLCPNRLLQPIYHMID